MAYKFNPEKFNDELLVSFLNLVNSCRHVDMDDYDVELVEKQMDMPGGVNLQGDDREILIQAAWNLEMDLTSDELRYFEDEAIEANS